MTRSTRRRSTLVVLIALGAGQLCLTYPVSGQGAPPDPEELASALARPAVVYVETFWSGYVSDEEGEYFHDGEPLEFSTRCTGFVINPAGYVATAGHCVDDTGSFGGGKQRLIELAAAEAQEEGQYEGSPSEEELVEFGLANWTVEGTVKGGEIAREVFVQRGEATPGERGNSAMAARVVDFRSADAGDVALLKVDESDLPTVVVSGAQDPPAGTPVLSVGYPAPSESAGADPIEPRVDGGEVIAAKTQGDYRVYELTTVIGDGMSGGPTVNLQGEVIGVNSFQTASAATSSFVVSFANLREVMARNQVESELGRVDNIYRSGLDAFYAGRFADAARAFEEVLELDPAHTEASSYRARIKPDPPTPVSERPIPLVAVGFGLAMLAAVGGTVVMRRAGAWPGPTRGVRRRS